MKETPEEVVDSIWAIRALAICLAIFLTLAIVVSAFMGEFYSAVIPGAMGAWFISFRAHQSLRRIGKR